MSTPREVPRNRLKVLRAARGWSQDHLAALLGSTRQTINAIEAGRTAPGIATALRIARIFGLPVEQVFEVDDIDSTGQARPAGDLPRDDRRIADLQASVAELQRQVDGLRQLFGGTSRESA